MVYGIVLTSIMGNSIIEGMVFYCFNLQIGWENHFGNFIVEMGNSILGNPHGFFEICHELSGGEAPWIHSSRALRSSCAPRPARDVTRQSLEKKRF